MYHPVKTIQDFTKSLTGLWSNPQTNNQFYFTADHSNGSKGTIDIYQYGLNEPISLRFHLLTKGDHVVLKVEGTPYDISLEDIHAHSLSITISPGKTLRLLKKLPRSSYR